MNVVGASNEMGPRIGSSSGIICDSYRRGNSSMVVDMHVSRDLNMRVVAVTDVEYSRKQEI